jgi:membrane protease YdiL (CAAX protease family)
VQPSFVAPPSRSTFRKIIQFPLSRLILALAMVLGPLIIFSITFSLLPLKSPVFQLLGAVLITGLAMLSYASYVRLVEQRPVTEFDRTGAFRELATGILIGTALFTTTIGLIALAGSYHVEGRNQWTAVITPLAGAIVSGIVEEIVARAILFRIAEDVAGSWLGVLLSASLFGLLHLLNPHAGVLSSLAIGLEAGVLLGAAYMYTRRLWLAIGIHAAWNFTQGGVFGVNVSGKDTTGLLQGVLTGPAWLSGGEFGAEASLVAVAVCLVAGPYLCVRAARAGMVVRPMWRRRLGPAGNDEGAAADEATLKDVG